MLPYTTSNCASVPKLGSQARVPHSQRWAQSCTLGILKIKSKSHENCDFKNQSHPP